MLIEKKTKNKQTKKLSKRSKLLPVFDRGALMCFLGLGFFEIFEIFEIFGSESEPESPPYNCAAEFIDLVCFALGASLSSLSSLSPFLLGLVVPMETTLFTALRLLGSSFRLCNMFSKSTNLQKGRKEENQRLLDFN